MISVKAILGLSVETRSGEKIGSVVGAILDPSSHTIVQYEVRPPFLKEGPFPKTRLINPKQVVSMDEKKMIVEDLVVYEGEKAEAAGAAALGP